MEFDWLAHRVIVTGANGFIGSQLCEAFLSLGIQVVAIVRSKTSVGRLSHLPKTLKIVECDLAKSPLPNTIFTERDIIIHAAGLDGGKDFKRSHANELFSTNTTLLKHVLDSFTTVKPKKIVYISSADVYYKTDSTHILKEDQLVTDMPTDDLGYYSWSKILGEQEISEFGKRNKITTLVIRPSSIFGWGDSFDKQRLVPTLLQAFSEGKSSITLPLSTQIRTFTYVEDFTKNFIQLIQYADGGVYNLSSDLEISVKDFVLLFGKVFQLNIKASEYTYLGPTQFILDNSNAKSVLPVWHDTAYEKAFRAMLLKSTRLL